MSAHDLLEKYLSGERAPVQGPLTYVEVVGLQSIHDKLLAALLGMVAVPSGTGVTLLQAKLKAHHEAHLAIRLATARSPVVNAPQGAGFRSVTPVCGNCSHERKCRSNDGDGTARSCNLFGWPVQRSGTCDSHAYSPMVAKRIEIACAQ